MSDAQYSAIIPTYNRARTLPRAFASIAGQTLPPSEIIIVDDGSSDDTPSLVGTFTGLRPRLITHPKNMGAAAARNTGARAASAPWLAFLDSDDAWMPDKMARQLAALATAGAQVRGSVTGYRILDERHGREEIFVPTPADVGLDAVVGGCRLSPGSGLVVARDVFIDLGGLDTTLPRLEDWDWLIRFLVHHALVAISEPLVVVHKGSDPSYAQVKAAVQQLRTLHRDFFYRRSWLTGRHFDSALLIEEAAGAKYAGDKVKAMILTLRAVATYPFQDASFFGKLVRHAMAGSSRITNPEARRMPGGDPGSSES
jgi:glycosyltransferase involved in cell wall biosynthesis